MHILKQEYIYMHIYVYALYAHMKTHIHIYIYTYIIYVCMLKIWDPVMDPCHVNTVCPCIQQCSPVWGPSWCCESLRSSKNLRRSRSGLQVVKVTWSPTLQECRIGDYSPGLDFNDEVLRNLISKMTIEFNKVFGLVKLQGKARRCVKPECKPTSVGEPCER